VRKTLCDKCHNRISEVEKSRLRLDFSNSLDSVIMHLLTLYPNCILHYGISNACTRRSLTALPPVALFRRTSNNATISDADVYFGLSYYKRLKRLLASYKSGVTWGWLPPSLNRRQQILRLEEIPDVKISLREYTRKLSLCSGQGYKEWFCKGKYTYIKE
jgi:hypothetical protein